MLLVNALAGCLSSDTVININRAGKGSKMDIHKVVCQFNGAPHIFCCIKNGKEICQRSRGWDLRIDTFVNCAVEGVVRLSKLKNAWCSGEKQTCTVTTNTGRSIRATAEHPFLTDCGWLPLDQLEVGLSVLVDIGRRNGDNISAKINYPQTSTIYHPHQVNNGNCWKVAKHRLVVESVMNGFSFEDYVWILRNDVDAAYKCRYLKQEQIVHHLDGNSYNFDYDNLEVLASAKDHSDQHAWGNNVLMQVGTEKIVSVVPFGKELTYDLELEADPHNFLANGFVVHNTGKTTTAMFGLGVQVPKGMTLSNEQLAIVKRMRSYSWEKAAAMAFNVPIAAELKKRVPAGVEAATTNAFGYRAWLKHIDRKKIKVSQWKTANILKTISDEGYLKEEELRKYTPDISKIVSLLKSNLLDWTHEHIEFLGEKYDVEIDEMMKTLVVQVMEESVVMEDEFDFDDQLFMPILKNISFPKFDLIVIDECQDLNAAKQELAFRSLSEGGNLIAIGDRHQCQPGDTKVTICHKIGDRWNLAKYSYKYLRDVKAGDYVVAFNAKERAYVNQAKVVQVSQRAYCGMLLSVTTEEGKTTRCTPNHKFMVKWAKDLPTELWCTYVMRKGDYYRVGWCQMFTVRGDFHLGMRSRLEDADAAWIVSIHTTKSEASFNEQKLALLYGIPTVMFLETNGNYIYSQDNLDDFWAWTVGGLDIEASIITLLEELGLSKDTPFYVKGTGRKKGRTTCFELEASNLIIIQEYVSMPSTDNISSNRGQDFTKVTSVTSEMYQGYVYSLEVDLYGTYIADGVCTHNSIYGFSGADAASMDTLADRMGNCGNFIELPLTVTRRCPKAVVVHANKYVPALKAHIDAMEGEVRYTNQSGFVDELVVELDGRMILCRTNAPLTGLAFKLLREDRACYIQGREIGQGLKKILVKTKEPLLVDAIPKGLAKIKARIEKLEKSHAIDTNKIEALRDQVLCIEYLAEELTTVEEFCNRIDILFQDETSNDKAHQLSTVHKAKGLERKHVCIYIPSTLPMKRKRKPGRTTAVAGDDQENNLAYVAYTRAQEILTFVVEDVKK